MSEFGRRGSGDNGESDRPHRRDRGSSGARGGRPERQGRPSQDRGQKRGDGPKRDQGEGRSPRGGRFERRDDRRSAPGDDRRGFGDRRSGTGSRGSGRPDRSEDDRSRDRRPDRERKPVDRRDDRPRRDTRPSRAAADRPRDDEEVAKDLLAAPELPEDVEFSELDEEARRELRTLPRDLAERIGRHLVAAGRLVDSDPEAALAHARYAKSKVSRVPIVREAVGLAAYHAGNWSEALSELRAVRRMTRTDTHVAVIADAERALGRPERALDLAKEVDPSTLTKDVAVELRIVAAGARRDLGQVDASVVALQGADLDPARREPWSARLFYAYADNLAAAGRRDEAVRWFMHAADADLEEETDAAERAAELGDE
ncbi:hypothetical protein [Qaidamihabitans albus]|uniref:hypothetical protein n=1 Tax=Qaidamihabitans albus TaxID=2795733 RepID=UPI0022A852D7|nr:hypothetical protein [Qaidamihabitans albus]